MEPVRIAVTGSGFMGRTHVEAARRATSAEPVAVAGGRRAPRLAADYGIACEPDTGSLLARDDVDAVVVATPHHVHVEEVLLAARAGKHVLVEKPLATTLADCDRMIAACREAGVVLSVGYHQRFRQTNVRTRELVADGAIGPVRCVQTSALFDAEAMRQAGGHGGDWGWWKDPRSVGHLINGGPHTVDLCRWWLGTEVASVSALCDTFREENPNENTTMALLEFASGAMGTYWSSSVVPQPGFPGESFRFRLMGDAGLIDCNPYGELRLARSGGEWETVCEQPPVAHETASGAFGDVRMPAYTDQIEAFVSTIRGRPGGEGTAEDGRAGVAAVLAMFEASRTRRAVAP